MSQPAEQVYQDYVVAHGLERTGLLESLQGKLGGSAAVPASSGSSARGGAIDSPPTCASSRGTSRRRSRSPKGGLVLSNDHQGDAREAAELSQLSLVAVVKERRGAVRHVERDLAGYLEGLAQRGRSPGRRSAPRADYYVFHKVREKRP